MTDNITTGAGALATKDLASVHYPKNLITDFAGVDAIGDVAANPAANTVLGRLKAIATALAGISTAAKQDLLIAAIENISPGGGGAGDASAANQAAIIGHVDGIEGLLTSILAKIIAAPATEATLATIAGYLDTVETLIAATNTALATVNTNLGTIDGRVDGLEGLIGTTNTTLTTIGGYLDTVEALLTAMSAKLPASLGAKTGANSLSIVPATDAGMATAAKQDEATAAINGLTGTEYETVPASATNQALGATGATGDLLVGLLIIPATTSPGAVTIKDGAGNAITVFAGGASSVGSLHPFFVPLGIKSGAGAWQVTTGTNVSAIGIGNFT